MRRTASLTAARSGELPYARCWWGQRLMRIRWRCGTTTRSPRRRLWLLAVLLVPVLRLQRRIAWVLRLQWRLLLLLLG